MLYIDCVIIIDIQIYTNKSNSNNYYTPRYRNNNLKLFQVNFDKLNFSQPTSNKVYSKYKMNEDSLTSRYNQEIFRNRQEDDAMVEGIVSLL